MNLQERKPFEEVLGYLEGYKRITLMGCGGCATIFHTGGISDVEEMAGKLEAEGKEIVGKIGILFGVFTCYIPMAAMFLKEHRKEMEECDAILMMSCGDGLQAVRGYLDEEMGIVKPMYPSNNALGFSSGGPTDFREECQGCGACELGKTAGICPLVQCPKGLMNGPCGGTRSDGKCEVDPEKDCAWVQIYRRLDKLASTESYSEILEPHDWSKQTRPRTRECEPLDPRNDLRRGLQIDQHAIPEGLTMATKVILPKMGQTMEEGTIVEWFKKEGDPVDRGDALFSVESDKAVLEVEARDKGVLRKILVPAGAKVPIMTPVGIVGAPDEDIGELLEEAAPRPGPVAEYGVREAETPHPSPPPEYGEREEVAPVHAAGERIVASPRARRVAAERGVDLTYVAGSGPDGRIVEKDVLTYAAAQPKATPLARRLAAEAGIPLAGVAPEGARVTAAQVRAAVAGAAPLPEYAPSLQPSPRVRGEGVEVGAVTPMAGVRAVIAERMATSAQTTAAVTLQSVVDATELVTLRTRLKDALAEELGFAIGYNDLLACIVARCLTEFPYMNARLEPEGIRQLPEVNLGLAVDSDRGLLVPVIRGAERMGVKELAVRFREVVARVRDGKAQPDDLTGGTFTVTNLGMYGVDAFTPIINLPECAILGVGRIRPEPVVESGQVVVRQRMWLSLTFDHRLVDGAPAARFLQAVMHYIESPYLLLA